MDLLSKVTQPASGGAVVKKKKCPMPKISLLALL